MKNVKAWFAEMDGLLRGDKTQMLLGGKSTEAIRLSVCITASVVLGMVYGLFMGLFAVMTRQPPSWPQLFSTALKVPALYLLTLVITFPSLYVFSALLGTRLRFIDALRVLVAAIAVNLCVLAAFGPITGFFTISTTSYPFMKLLNMAFFAIAGFLGLGFLVRVLQMLETGPAARAPAAAGPVSGAPPTLPDPNSQRVPPRAPPPPTRKVLVIWLIVYAVVGAQMGWVLRPFVGSPDLPFVVFRGREANIFIDLARTIGSFLN